MHQVGLHNTSQYMHYAEQWQHQNNMYQAALGSIRHNMHQVDLDGTRFYIHIKYEGELNIYKGVMLKMYKGWNYLIKLYAEHIK